MNRGKTHIGSVYRVPILLYSELIFVMKIPLRCYWYLATFPPMPERGTFCAGDRSEPKILIMLWGISFTISVSAATTSTSSDFYFIVVFVVARPFHLLFVLPKNICLELIIEAS
jgi:hypothetical protein